jgi:cytochrome c-type biogenesis protein CcmH
VTSSATLVLALLAMTAVAIAVVLLPLLRPRRTRVLHTASADDGDTAADADEATPVDADSAEPRSAPVSAVAVAISIPVVAALSYLSLSNFDWANLSPAAQTAASTQQGPVPNDVINQLARRLENEGGTLDEWRLLGRSLLQAARFDEAEQALREAYRQASSVQDQQVLAATGAEYAEAMILADERALATDAGTLLERVLELDPTNPRALWWGGLGAFERGEYTRSVARWTDLLNDSTMNDEQMRQVVQQRVQLAQRLASEGAPPPADIRAQMQAGAAGADGESVAGATAQATEDAEPNAGAAVSVRVSVNLADSLAGLGGGDVHPVFVIARRPGGGGPPLAVVRRASNELPLEVELSDENAMIPGRGISSVDEVEIVARIALGGTPVAASGDPYGSQRVQVTPDALVEITISERTP